LDIQPIDGRAAGQNESSGENSSAVFGARWYCGEFCEAYLGRVEIKRRYFAAPVRGFKSALYK